jgi:hypothetical protein
MAIYACTTSLDVTPFEIFQRMEINAVASFSAPLQETEMGFSHIPQNMSARHQGNQSQQDCEYCLNDSDCVSIRMYEFNPAYSSPTPRT